jgi:multiple sugar transport system ATP-binding protein
MKTSDDASVKIKNLVKTYTDSRGRPTFTAVKNIDLDIESGEFMVLVGPSGCGKSTTLRMVAGLEKISSGTISIGDKVVNNLEPKDRGISMVFQSYALYPHMNLFNNMAFGLKLAKKPKDQIAQLVSKTGKALGLDKMLERKPAALSGGQRQRVALGRAIVREPKVFLFDEPLSNLDAKMRVQMRAEISRLHGEMNATMIYVTHDQVEAMTMGDRICVMRDGNIMQVADPITLFRKPENMFVAGFIGSPPMNLVKGKIQKRDGGLLFVENASSNPLTLKFVGELEAIAGKNQGKDVVFGIRPENIHNAPDAEGLSPAVKMKVEISEPMGSESLVYLKTGSGNLIARIQGDHIFHTGDDMDVYFEMDKGRLFDPGTEQVLN